MVSYAPHLMVRPIDREADMPCRRAQCPDFRSFSPEQKHYGVPAADTAVARVATDVEDDAVQWRSLLPQHPSRLRRHDRRNYH